MAPPCKKIKYKNGKRNKPVVRIKKRKPSPPPVVPESSPASLSDDSQQQLFTGEEDFVEFAESKPIDSPVSPLVSLRQWLQTQRFIPKILPDDFLMFFLSASGYYLEEAKSKLEKYFRSRQEPSPLFRDRDPLSPANVEIFKKLYVLPAPDTTEDGRKIILTGLKEPTLRYNQLDHLKVLAMVLDLLIWEKDFGFGDFVIVFDGTGFQCPQLLENGVSDHRSIKSLLLDTIPGTLRSFFLLYPPPHVTHVADNRNGIWITVVRSKREMISYLPADVLPLEYGGNLGHLKDLLDQWNLHMVQCREFFITFEKTMEHFYRRRLCYEKEIASRGKNWVQEMKLEADEWEYKIKYYEKMKNFQPLKHKAFGSSRKLGEMKSKSFENPLIKIWKMAKAEEEAARVFQASLLNHGYATDLRRTQPEDQKEEKRMEVEGEGGDGSPMTARLPGMEEIGEEENEEDEEEEEKSTSETDIDFEDELIEFHRWLEKQPYLPKNVDEEVLITFLWDAQSVEDAEGKFTNYFYMRQSLASVFHERHPCSPNNLLKYNAVCVIPLTSGLDKKWIVFATWLSHEDPTKFSIYHMTKLIFTELDILLQENQIRGKRISVIIDMKGYSEDHTAMITKYAAKKICYLFTHCFPATFNGFYILNAPIHVADFTQIFGPIDFHIVDDVEDLQGFLPKKFLPSDMGGDSEAPNRDSLFEPFFKRMQRCGNWLAYEEFMRSQELMLRMTTAKEEFSYGVIK